MKHGRNDNYFEGQAFFSKKTAAFAAVILWIFSVLTIGASVEPAELGNAVSQELTSFMFTGSFGENFLPNSVSAVFWVRGDEEDVVSSDKDTAEENNGHLEALEKAEAVFAMKESPSGAMPVVKTVLLPSKSFESINGVYINNESKKDLSVEPKRIILQKDETEPQVLIYHTHGTECYNPGYSFYDDDIYSVNTTDTTKNVVRIGTVIADVLEENGIKTIHMTEMFDASGYSDAYERSCAAVEKVLAENPSIKIVLDIHRDTVIDSEGTKLRPVVSTESGAAAQLMILLGSGRSGAQVPQWRENLSFALAVCAEINEISEDILRPIMLRATRYNQHLSVGAILVEVGTCGNTLSEAERAAAIFAKALAESCLKTN